MIVIIYVDDLIILTNNLINKLKSSLEHEFKMNDIGELHFFLGVHFKRNRRTRAITIYQKSYMKIILDQFGMGNPIRIPFNAKTSLLKL